MRHPRRILSVPIAVLAFFLWLAATPLWLPIAAVVDAVRGAPRVAVRIGALVGAYLAYQVIGLVCIAALGAWGALARPGRERWEAVHFRLQTWWLLRVFRAVARLFALDVESEGTEDADLDRGPLLVLVRHASMGDALLPGLLLSVPHGTQLRYVLKRELLWDPCLDIVGNRLPNVFVDRFSDDPGREIARLQELARDLGPRDGIVIYPEGTRFSPEKRARILEKLAAAGDAKQLEWARSLSSTLPPRPGGTLGLLDAAPRADVLVCMHTGFEGSASPLDVWNGALLRRTIRIRVRRIRRREIPDGREARAAWLRDEWRRVDEWVTRNRADLAPCAPATGGAQTG